VTIAEVRTFEPDALRRWLAERNLRPAAFAAAIGHDRVTVYRWLSGSRPPEIPIALLQRGIALGASGRDWESDRLRRWMGREVYDTGALAADIGMHRTTIGRWLGDLRPPSPLPFWLPIALAALEGDVAARRERRRAQRHAARAS
jgi:hypothetical protein